MRPLLLPLLWIAISIWLACNGCTLVSDALPFHMLADLPCVQCARAHQWISKRRTHKRVYGKFNYLNYHILVWNEMMMPFRRFCHWAYNPLLLLLEIDLKTTGPEQQFFFLSRRFGRALCACDRSCVYICTVALCATSVHVDVKATATHINSGKGNGEMPMNLEQRNKTSLLFAVSLWLLKERSKPTAAKKWNKMETVMKRYCRIRFRIVCADDGLTVYLANFIHIWTWLLPFGHDFFSLGSFIIRYAYSFCVSAMTWLNLIRSFVGRIHLRLCWLFIFIYCRAILPRLGSSCTINICNFIVWILSIHKSNFRIERNDKSGLHITAPTECNYMLLVIVNASAFLWVFSLKFVCCEWSL